MPRPFAVEVTDDMRQPFALHDAAARGDLNGLRRLLSELPAGAINAYDGDKLTPLMQASNSGSAGTEMLQWLLANGAEVDAPSTREPHVGKTALAFAAADGDPAKVAALLDAGANLLYRRNGYGVLLDAVYGRTCGFGDPRLITLLELLIARGARLDDITQFHESALRVLSNRGRFDAVALLLEAGADASQLEWTALHQAIALGNLADMEIALTSSADLEGTDFWSRTPLLLAILSGDIAKVDWLLTRGARRDAVGRCGKPPLFYAIEGHHEPMLRWLIAQGFPPGLADQFGTPALTFAAESRNFAAVRILLDAGMSPNEQVGHLNALYSAADRDIALSLLEAGADPNDLDFEARRAIVGLVSEPSTKLIWASPSEFASGWRRRFGTTNPEEHADPFWRAMVISGVSAYSAACHFQPPTEGEHHPIWCAERFGQSITLLPDGRILQIGGEHEDSYDENFCIYNDVFVHNPDGSFHIYGYPQGEFPPTDFHTATLIGGRILIIGSLGYRGARSIGSTPVYALDTRTLHIVRVTTTGPAPGWIYRHRATLISPCQIQITGGRIATLRDGEETHDENAQLFVLDVEHMEWRTA